MENIIIVGAGPAGISAALYAARGNMDPLIINTGIGSLEKAEKIENYYGLEKPLSGKDLFERGLEIEIAEKENDSEEAAAEQSLIPAIEIAPVTGVDSLDKTELKLEMS